MDLNCIPSTLRLVLLVVVTHGLATGTRSTQRLQSQEQSSLQAAVIKRMDNIQSHLEEITRSMGDLDEELSKALYNCLGLHTELCEALEVDARLKNRQQMTSSWSPGKRSASTDPKVNMYRSLFDDLKRKRAMLKRLSHVFHGAHKLMGIERKRSCSLNLGFHCQTEDISNFADMFNYLENPMSPGKRSAPLEH